MEGYSAKVIEASKELSAKEKVMYKDTSDCIKFDMAIDSSPDGYIIVKPVAYVVVQIHNEKAKPNKDYNNYIVIDESGERFVTGSQSFWSTFSDIFADMQDCTEDWGIKVYKKDSKNNTNPFITCSVV